MAEKRKCAPSLEAAFRFLSATSPEKLLSLTFKLGRGEAERLVRALVLLSLSKQAEALAELRELTNNDLASYLAESGNSHSPPKAQGSPLSADILIDLARVFKILADEGLCKDSFRDEAYLAAIRACESAQGTCKVDVGKLRMEAKEKCGPHLDCGGLPDSGTTLKSFLGLCSYLPWKPEHRSPAIQIMRTENPSAANSGNSPSSLRSSSGSQVSFPSHLEVSASPTNTFLSKREQDQKTVSSERHQEDFMESIGRLSISSTSVQQQVTVSAVPLPGEEALGLSVLTRLEEQKEGAEEEGNLSVDKRFVHVQPESSHNPQDTTQSLLDKGSHARPLESTVSMGGHQTITSKEPSADFPVQPGKKLLEVKQTAAAESSDTDVQSETKDSKNNSPRSSPSILGFKEEDSGEKFYSFVILHAAEDSDIASELQLKLESLGAGEGATFSEDFEVPGRHTLTCIQDAIDNSAFTILLLTKNFNTRLLEHKTNSVLMNSIEKQHKYNTVIPFLPRENFLTRKEMPLCLKIYNPLDEGRTRNFEKIARKTFAPEKVERQRQLWKMEQSIKAAEERKEQLKGVNARHERLVKAASGTAELEQERLHLQQELLRQMYAGWMAGMPQPQFSNPNVQPDHHQMFCGPHFVPPCTQTCGVGPPNSALPFSPAGLYNFLPPPVQQVPQGYHSDGFANMVGAPACQPSNIIQIHNASHIMIGNDSSMSVGVAVERTGEGDEDHAPSAEGKGPDPVINNFL
ncbi:TIR domain-containing adapter molecule 1 [Lepisosteus oculatus]|uniref:TIR domain-containing adapter molecule 1 n=1 Tax=Lepisosteus oculatus TaxID=7918 RepID=UPI0037198E2A